MVNRSRTRGSSSGAALSTPAVKTFAVENWTASDDYYSVTMTALEHLRGTSRVLYQIEELTGGDYVDAGSGVRSKWDPNTGTITVYVNRNSGSNENRFAGRFLVW